MVEAVDSTVEREEQRRHRKQVLVVEAADPIVTTTRRSVQTTRRRTGRHTRMVAYQMQKAGAVLPVEEPEQEALTSSWSTVAARRGQELVPELEAVDPHRRTNSYLHQIHHRKNLIGRIAHWPVEREVEQEPGLGHS
jgi:hypothetical protein